MKQNKNSKNKGLIALTFLLYNIALLPFFIFIPVFLVVFLPFLKRLKTGFLNRFGFIANAQEIKGKTLIHTSSVGEYNGIKPLLRFFENNNNPYVLSSFTDTGLRTIRLNAPKIISFILPLDHPLFLLPIIFNKPKTIIFVEADLWPNLILLCGLLDIDVYLVNGRISLKKTRLILLLPFFYKPVLSCFKKIFLQDSLSASNLKKAHIKVKNEVTGSTKLDISHIILPSSKEILLLQEKLVLKGKTVITGGSLRDDEYRLLTQSFLAVHSKHKNIVLILAPRHLNDIKKYQDYLESLDIAFCKISEPDKKQSISDIHIVDIMGIMMTIYSLSDIVFIGGTLAPIGGHNPLEPAITDNAILHGPSIHNNYTAFKLLDNSNAAKEIKSNTLTDAINDLIEHPKLQEKLKNNAKSIVQAQQSVSRIIYDKIME